MCENVTCIEPATERITVHTARGRAAIDDHINLCTKHADILSAKQTFGPHVRQWVTREPIPQEAPRYDAGL
jgi:hypothetical protein